MINTGLHTLYVTDYLDAHMFDTVSLKEMTANLTSFSSENSKPQKQS